MSEQKSDAWEKLWQEYSNSLKKWNERFELFQKVSNEIQRTYHEAIQMILSKSSKDIMMEFFDEEWQKAMNEAGANTFKQFSERWQKGINEYGTDSFKKFGQGGQKFMLESSLESMKAYGKMMNKFGETWKKTKKDNNLSSQESENLSSLSNEELMKQFIETKKGEPSRMGQENKSAQQI